MKLYVKIVSVIAVLFCASTFANSAYIPITTDESKVEVLYFFSLKCSGCAGVRDYVRLWKQLNTRDESIVMRKIPVVLNGSKQWIKAVELYFVGKYLMKKYDLPESKMEVLMFQLALQNIDGEVFSLRESLEQSGMPINDNEWSTSLRFASSMSAHSLSIQNELNVSQTPMAIITGNAQRIIVRFDAHSQNAPLDFVTRLSREVAKVLN
ncbi:MAG: hypothetical protein HAW67_02360 [Endozoicomonadaceae bacterium]|nr:hypothetical protein [Endozoicomonadaceae bacterium]